MAHRIQESLLQTKSFYYLILSLLIFTFSVGCDKDPDKKPDDKPVEANTVTDHEGNTYKCVKIGDQVWMGENLQVITYRNGDSISTTTPYYADISQMTNDQKYQWAYMGLETNVATYGRLYTWKVIDDPRGVCPTGYHIPSDFEWVELVAEVGDFILAGGNLKEAGMGHWTTPNTGATNKSGFTALPGGWRLTNGAHNNLGLYANFWSSDSLNNYQGIMWYLSFNYEDICRMHGHMNEGYSVRCLKDN